MNEQLAVTILSLVEQAILQEPKIEAALRAVFAKTEATPADWAAEKQALLGASYKDLVPHSKLP